MPNPCVNDINVFGEPEVVERFFEKVQGGFSLTDFVPPDKNVLFGKAGYVTLIRKDGAWEVTDLTVRQAEMRDYEVYRGSYMTTEDGVTYTEPEMDEAGLIDWYTWNFDNWGTKWDASDAEVDRIDEKNLHIYFMTPWSPPKPVVHAMQEQYPDLTISMEYDEEGMMFRGVVHPDGSSEHEEYWEQDEEDLDD